MNRRAIMEKVIYERYEKALISAASKINNGWNDSTVEADIRHAEEHLKKDLEKLDEILGRIEES
jgi:hypothetical protein